MMEKIIKLIELMETRIETDGNCVTLIEIKEAKEEAKTEIKAIKEALEKQKGEETEIIKSPNCNGIGYTESTETTELIQLGEAVRKVFKKLIEKGNSDGLSALYWSNDEEYDPELYTMANFKSEKDLLNWVKGENE